MKHPRFETLHSLVLSHKLLPVLSYIDIACCLLKRMANFRLFNLSTAVVEAFIDYVGCLGSHEEAMNPAEFHC